MKHLIIVLMLLASPVVVAQTKDRQGSRDAKVAEEIKRLEQTWLIDSYTPNDMTAFDRIVADDFLITHSNGKVLTKAEKRADIIGSHNPNPSPPPATDSVFKIEEASRRVRVFGDAAVSTGYIIEKYPYQGKEINDHVRFTNTYVRRQGRWQVVASHLNRIRQK